MRVNELQSLPADLFVPTFVHAGLTLHRRPTLVIRDARIENVSYPVFPSDRDTGQVLAWLQA